MILMCDEPDCMSEADWFVGITSRRAELKRGHAACDRHLADGCRITYTQLYQEGITLPLEVWPMQAVDSRA